MNTQIELKIINKNLSNLKQQLEYNRRSVYNIKRLIEELLECQNDCIKHNDELHQEFCYWLEQLSRLERK